MTTTQTPYKGVKMGNYSWLYYFDCEKYHFRYPWKLCEDILKVNSSLRSYKAFDISKNVESVRRCYKPQSPDDIKPFDECIKTIKDTIQLIKVVKSTKRPLIMALLILLENSVLKTPYKI